ncbi:hypothetical protein [Sciscionella sediminilitoris]|uniref:hypothetical protein n=1 Tax=Sciscionella sediminilitoris TaxID=1445613 RepID=UPI0004DF2B75|nr:hypothetical protein [Sciscionella sp. SE31]
MDNRMFLRSCLVAAVTVLAAIAGPVAQAEVAPHPAVAAQTAHPAAGHGSTAADAGSRAGAADLREPPPGGWDTPSQQSFYLTSSCQPYASAIRQGAAAWKGLTEGGGTPVECRTSYITDCGGGGNIVGCNWGQGQRIALFPGGVGDVPLLAAHEFGHDWYGHSNYQCAGWGSPEEVMAPSICTLRGTGRM